jgi:hypothetical protein
VPFGTQPGDLLWAAVYINGLADLDAPPDWTVFAQATCFPSNGAWIGIWLQKVAGAEPARHIFPSKNVQGELSGMLVAFKGTHPASPIDATTPALQVRSPPFAAPSITTTLGGEYQLASFMSRDMEAETWPAPDGMGQVATTGPIVLFAAPRPSPGATPSEATSVPFDGNSCVLVDTIAVRPAP